MNKNKLRQIIREEISYLNESNMSGAIYHFTHISKLVKILKSNSLKLGITIGSSKESGLSRGKLYYGSFTTVKTARVGYSIGMDVRIVVDARKLGYNHKIIPAQFFSNVASEWSPKKRAIADENEVRVVSDKSEIKNFSKYIMYIDVRISYLIMKMLSKEDVDNFSLEKLKPLFHIMEISRKLGIKIRFMDGDDFVHGIYKVYKPDEVEKMLSRVAGIAKTRNHSISEPKEELPILDEEFLFQTYAILRIFSNEKIANRLLDDVVSRYSHVRGEIKRENMQVDYIKREADKLYKAFIKVVKSQAKANIDSDGAINYDKVYVNVREVLGGVSIQSLINHTLASAIRREYFPSVQVALYKIYKRYDKVKRVVANDPKYYKFQTNEFILAALVFVVDAILNKR